MTMAGNSDLSGKKGDAQELDDIRMAEGAHQLTLGHKIGQAGGRRVVADELGRSGRPSNRNLPHNTVASVADDLTCQTYVGERKGPQLRVFRVVSFGHTVRNSSLTS